MKALVLIVACAVSGVPGVAHACTCCGDDDDQLVLPLDKDTYKWEQLKKLRLGEGWLTYAQGTEGWEITAISRVDDVFVFESKVGPFRFQIDMARSEYWISDISFITKPNKQSTDMVDMLHQIMFRGTLQLPPAAATELGDETLEATLALRGVGFACFEPETLLRWQFSAEMAKGWLAGGGTVQTEVEPAGS